MRSPLVAGGPLLSRVLVAFRQDLDATEFCRMLVDLERFHADEHQCLALVASRSNSEDVAVFVLDVEASPESLVVSIAIVLPVLSSMSLQMLGNGTFSLVDSSSPDRQYVFKTSSVRSMWSTVGVLRDAIASSLRSASQQSPVAPDWTIKYRNRTHLHRLKNRLAFGVAEAHSMHLDTRRRSTSPDGHKIAASAAASTDGTPGDEELIDALRTVMRTVDLDTVNSKQVRDTLERHFGVSLSTRKKFIDEQMITIMGQMDEPSRIFDNLYLGSEWNASNKSELQRNGVRAVLNMAIEISNFFEGDFGYMHVMIHDEPHENILQYFDRTYRFIKKTTDAGGSVFVHCKMGVSRSATAVVAYAMKENNWSVEDAVSYVRSKRKIVAPNKGFLEQLYEYEGILKAMRNMQRFLPPTMGESSSLGPLLSPRPRYVLHGVLTLTTIH
jgi:protein phosphatase slingshot